MELTTSTVASENPVTEPIPVLPVPPGTPPRTAPVDVTTPVTPTTPTTPTTPVNRPASKTKEERAADMVATLLGRFEDGSIAEPIQKTVIRLHSDDPLSNLPMDRWSFLNQINCVISGTMDARGANQWKEMGRHPRKGSSAIYITIPLFKTTWPEATPEEIADPNIQTTAAGKIRHQFLTGFKLGPVFRYEDTVAFPGNPEHLVQWDYTPPSLPPLTEFAKNLGLNVAYHAYEKASRGQLGSYHLTNGTDIDLYTEDNSTFFHELAHALHHRVLRSRGVVMEQVPLEIVETVAETAATVIASLYDQDYSGNCWEYLKRYTSDESTETVLRTLGKVTKDIESVINMVLDHAHPASTPTSAA